MTFVNQVVWCIKVILATITNQNPQIKYGQTHRTLSLKHMFLTEGSFSCGCYSWTQASLAFWTWHLIRSWVFCRASPTQVANGRRKGTRKTCVVTWTCNGRTSFLLIFYQQELVTWTCNGHTSFLLIFHQQELVTWTCNGHTSFLLIFYHQELVICPSLCKRGWEIYFLNGQPLLSNFF